MHISSATTLLLSVLPAAHAWGALGHETVAYIAQNYVSTKTASWAQTLLNDTSTSYLANIASWADTYRSTPAGSFSAPFHFIDALDSPPSSCGIDYARDCTGAGCVVSALANYTRRVTTPSLSASERNQALRFIVHFVGDMHQPLHNENYALGGNSISVTFAAAKRNLHGIWDTQIPERLRGAASLATAHAWATALSARIDTGVYAGDVGTWRAAVDTTDVVTSATRISNETNAFVCSSVVPKGWAAVQTGDLATDGYYNSTVPTVELQIARAGVRLAAWLDELSGVVTKRDVELDDDDDYLLGKDFLPAPRPLTAEQLITRWVRNGVGCGCAGHEDSWLDQV